MKDRKVRKEIKFGLLENAFDFVLSALRYIAKHKTKSDLKYAILHLCVGTELVLKERLRRAHWSLLFKDVNKANMRDYESGNFVSVSFGPCIERLRGICNISFLEKDGWYLLNLRERRNRLEHFGILDSVEALTGLAARVLSILLGFVNDELLPDDFSEAEADLLRKLRSKLGEFQRFVEKRSKQIGPHLKRADKESYIVECPVCYQEAFVLGDHPSCLFCGYSTEPEVAANEWIETILHKSYWSVTKDGEDYPLYACPECEREALVDIGPGGSQFEYDQYICFACGQAWEESSMNKCMTCGRPYLVQVDDSGMCPDCIKYQMLKD